MTTQPTATFQATQNLPECDFPVDHLNGTGRATLLAEYQAAERALSRFALQLKDVTCNPRDYYPLNSEAYADAKRTRDAAFALIDELSAYVDDHIAYLSR